MINNIIDYSATEKHLLSERKKYNATVQRRTDSIGRVRPSNSSERIHVHPNCLRTAMAIVHVLSAIRYKGASINVLPSQQFDTCLPQLETKTGYSKRTIQRHIKTLIAFGFLESKTNHPAQPIDAAKKIFHYQKFTLKVNPAFLVHYDVLNAADLAKDKRRAELTNLENHIALAQSETVCPHAHAEKFKRNNSDKSCEVVDNSQSNAPTSRIDLSAKKELLKKRKERNTVPISKGAKIEEGTDTTGALPAPAVPTTLILQLAMMLSNYALRKLYSHFTFIAEKERTYTLKFFSTMLATCKTEPIAMALYNEFMTRIDMRSTWMNKTPERVGKIARPSFYFDPVNPRGFTLTAIYYEQLKEEKKGKAPTDYLKEKDLDKRRVERVLSEYTKDPSVHNYNRQLRHLQRNSNNPDAAIRAYCERVIQNPLPSRRRGLQSISEIFQ